MSSSVRRWRAMRATLAGFGAGRFRGRLALGFFAAGFLPIWRRERAGVVRFTLFLGVRLAIGASLRNLDSIAISVLLSDAYRDS